MPRGCITTIIVLATLALVASILFYVFIWPDRQREGTSVCIHLIESAMDDYAADFESYPSGTNSEVAELLLGNNDRDKAYLTKKTVVLRGGEFVDFWKHPLRFAPAGNGRPAGLSAGPNGEFEDLDDITSQLIRDIWAADQDDRRSPN